jgi:hypothetical protein
MRFLNVVVLVMLIALAGCKKEVETPPASSEAVPNASAPTATPALSTQTPPPPPPPPAYIASQAENSVQANVTGVADAFLTSQLRIFVNEKGRFPQSFTEFARTRLDSVPRAPEGRKWVIDSASMEVKAVKK